MASRTPYELEFRSLGGELQVVIRGHDRHAENVLACWREIAVQAQRRDAVRLLAISHVAGEPMPVDKVHAFLGSMAGLGLEGVRVAYVDTQGFKTPLMETAEIMASEQGFSVRVFDNLIAAEMWLRHGDE
jgi:hypothetical protein